MSSAIISNLERYFSDNYQSDTILQELLKLSGIAAIKEDAQLTGNQILIVPLTAGVIAPIVGRGFRHRCRSASVLQQRLHLAYWGAAGLMVKTDINSKNQSSTHTAKGR